MYLCTVNLILCFSFILNWEIVNELCQTSFCFVVHDWVNGFFIVLTLYFRAEVRMNSSWRVGAGENSKVRQVQTYRNQREKGDVLSESQTSLSIPRNLGTSKWTSTTASPPRSPSNSEEEEEESEYYSLKFCSHSVLSCLCRQFGDQNSHLMLALQRRSLNSPATTEVLPLCLQRRRWVLTTIPGWDKTIRRRRLICVKTRYH